MWSHIMQDTGEVDVIDVYSLQNATIAALCVVMLLVWVLMMVACCKVAGWHGNHVFPETTSCR